MADQKITLTVQVNADTGQLEVLGAKMKQAGDSAKSAFANFLPAATAAGILSFFVKAIQGAEEENESLRRLSSTIIQNGGNWEANRQKVLSWTQSVQELTRFSDSQALVAIDKLTRTTGNLAQGMSASRLAMDLSVKTGKSLEETILIINNLILGQSRALMEARREFGTMAGAGSTAQEVLDALARSSQGAAEQEKSLTKDVHVAMNAWKEFGDVIGNTFSPLAAGLAKTLTVLVQVVQGLGTEIAGFVKESVTALTGLWNVIREGSQGNFAAAAAAAKQTMRDIVSDHIATQEVVAEVFKVTNEKVRQDFIAAANERIQVHHTLTQEELKAREEMVQKSIQMEAELTQKINALGVQTYQKKLATFEAEIATNRAKINRELQDEVLKQKALDKLNQYEKTGKQQLAKDEVFAKQEAAFNVANLAIQTLQTVNALADKGSSAERTRAKALLALQQSIAIGWAWVHAVRLAGPFAPAIAAAETALIVAQFAQGLKQIDQAGARESAGIGSITTNLPTPGIDLGAGGGIGNPSLGGGGVSISSGGGGGGGGGGGVGTIINVGGIVVNFSTDKLALDNVTVVMNAMYEKIRQATIEGVQLAVALQNLANNNSARAV